MNRRQFLSASVLALLVPGATAAASEAYHVEYSREAYQQALASGRPFMLDFYAPW
jgi:thiol:disulfide interchange protein